MQRGRYSSSQKFGNNTQYNLVEVKFEILIVGSVRAEPQTQRFDIWSDPDRDSDVTMFPYLHFASRAFSLERTSIDNLSGRTTLWAPR